MTQEYDIETLIVAAHALTRLAAAETRNETPAAQWRTISLLRDHGPLRIGELATLSRVTQPGMTRLAGQMADAGLLERTQDAADSRATVLSVTDAGLAALDEWRAQLREALAPHFADLDDVEREALRVAASVLARRTGALEVAR
ncbi:MarR family winged helix-turn-helix transcriptional regulator [Microbacterium ulmi]|uniref:MarR family winged helix-turn-helix transcriptional regulator n=1 Tax=Microbacterium ulmi TaxID=179095 RepID=UPI003132F2FE|nr:DNA-binding MarR family transcriptional regulator [Microbacterium ulmi]